VKKLKVVVVGAGRLGGFHARKLAGLDDVELLAVVDPLPESRRCVAAECHTQGAADWHLLSEKFDAAVIAAPTTHHHALAMELLDRGVHLLVEKPLCATLAEADELVHTAQRRGLVLQVGHVERFNPAFTAAAAHLRDPKYIEAVRAGGFTFRSTDIGVVLDLMIHDLDLVLALVSSRVRKVEALGLSVVGGHEDVANARVEFECGCVAALSASRVSYEAVRRMQVWTPRALAGIDFAARTATLVSPSETLLRRQFDVEQLSPEQIDYYREHFADEHLPRQRWEFEAVDALALELRDFIDSIRTSRAPRVPGSQGRDAIALAEQILNRIETHAWDETCDGPVGPLATPRPRIIPAPHFNIVRHEIPIVRKDAG
jgi:predicted dehydrogenase